MSKSQRTVAALLLLISIAGAARAEVWKCTIDGKPQYSDRPCQASGAPMTQRSLQANVVDSAVDRAKALATEAEQPPPSPPRPAPQPVASANVCPSDRDIASMETTASSTTMNPESKRFVQDEIRRARQCQKGLGNYSAADWAISKEAVNAQSSLSGAADARRRSEAMHSAANPAEGELIARQRDLEDREALRRQRPPRINR